MATDVTRYRSLEKTLPVKLLIPSYSSLSAAEASCHDDEPKYLCMAVEKKYVWDNGQTIRVKFLGGTVELQNLVKEAAKEWEKYANINFDFIQTESHVRISFEQGKGSYSVVGKNALSPRYTEKSTMNLDIASQNALGRMAVVLHEFGHVLGCIHEHCSPSSATIELDRNAVYKHYKDTNGWNKKTVDDNIFRTYRKEDLQFSSAADEKSIMMYNFNALLANGSVPAPRISKLSKEDQKFIAEVYPNRIQLGTVRHNTTTW